ncbi:wings apart-like protein homolog, partial, partial [Tachysurus ichikawai]
MLSDAPQHPSLALCTAALLYILSRDRLNMDLDRACLELMIRLLEMEQDESEDHQSKVKEKIQKLCETVHNKHLDLDNITVSHNPVLFQGPFTLLRVKSRPETKVALVQLVKASSSNISASIIFPSSVGTCVA